MCFGLLVCLAILGLFLIGGDGVQQGSGKGDSNERILYGKEATCGQFPFMALTVLSTEEALGVRKATLCGGALVHKRWVVSAAHCLKVFRTKPPTINVTLGLTDRANKTGALVMTLTENSAFVHPAFVMNKPSTPDLVLYHLPSPATSDKRHPYICTIPLPKLSPDSVYQFDDQNVTTLGWGITESGASSDVLRYSKLRVMNHKQCLRRYPQVGKAFICTQKSPEFTGPCPGDSGSPLVSEKCNGKLELIGITSHSKAHESCFDPKGIDLYTYVPFHLEWIKQVMAENCDTA